MERFLWQNQKGHVYAFPSRTIEDLVVEIQTALATVDSIYYGMLERMPCGP